MQTQQDAPNLTEGALQAERAPTIISLQLDRVWVDVASKSMHTSTHFLAFSQMMQ